MIGSEPVYLTSLIACQEYKINICSKSFFRQCYFIGGLNRIVVFGLTNKYQKPV